MSYFLCYVSTARWLFSDAQLQQLLGQCDRSNVARGVTGALLYRDGTFMQVLEGEQRVVTDLFAVISADSRHYDVTHIVDGTASVPQFDRWSMAFRDLSGDTGHLGSAYSDFFNPHPTHGYSDRPTLAQRLLIGFRRTLVSS